MAEVLDSPGRPRAVAPGDDRPTAHLLHQRFRYTYTVPVRNLRHRLVVVPPVVHGSQRRLFHRVTTTGAEATSRPRADRFGNHVVQVRAAIVRESIEFEVWTVVRRDPARQAAVLGAAAAADPRLLRGSTLTRADQALAEVARSLVDRPGSDGGGLGLAERACSWAHHALRYGFDVTTVRTTAAEALAGGRGVCQDHAHLMVAVCRAAGVAARYVSGHLEGEGGSHAWVEVIVPDPHWGGGATVVAFDPTHDRRAGAGYVTVAVGRDYTDVAPTSGLFEGEGTGVLSTTKQLRALATDIDLSDALTRAGRSELWSIDPLPDRSNDQSSGGTVTSAVQRS